MKPDQDMSKPLPPLPDAPQRTPENEHHFSDIMPPEIKALEDKTIPWQAHTGAGYKEDVSIMKGDKSLPKALDAIKAKRWKSSQYGEVAKAKRAVNKRDRELKPLKSSKLKPREMARPGDLWDSSVGAGKELKKATPLPKPGGGKLGKIKKLKNYLPKGGKK